MEIRLLSTSIMLLLITIGLLVLALAIGCICDDVKGKDFASGVMILSGVCGILGLMMALAGLAVNLIN